MFKSKKDLLKAAIVALVLSVSAGSQAFAVTCVYIGSKYDGGINNPLVANDDGLSGFVTLAPTDGSLAKVECNRKVVPSEALAAGATCIKKGNCTPTCNNSSNFANNVKVTCKPPGGYEVTPLEEPMQAHK